MEQQRLEYALVSNIPCVPFLNPGNHRVINAVLNAQQQRDEEALFVSCYIVWVPEGNVLQASIAVLNLAVPEEYKRTNGIETTK